MKRSHYVSLTICLFIVSHILEVSGSASLQRRQGFSKISPADIPVDVPPVISLLATGVIDCLGQCSVYHMCVTVIWDEAHNTCQMYNVQLQETFNVGQSSLKGFGKR